MIAGKTLTDGDRRDREDLKEFFEERAGILEYDAGIRGPKPSWRPRSSR
jgi:hypothetical protein